MFRDILKFVFIYLFIALFLTKPPKDILETLGFTVVWLICSLCIFIHLFNRLLLRSDGRATFDFAAEETSWCYSCLQIPSVWMVQSTQ